MRLGFFGGSFDPPHGGHLAIALAAAEHFSLDQVLMAPTGRQPLKRLGAEAGFPDRLAMTHLLCEGHEQLLASDIDAPHRDGTPNYTVDALGELRRQTMGADLFAIIGADILRDLPQWHESDRLFGLATWIAVSRPGHSLSEIVPAALHSEMKAGHLCLLNDIAVPVSSTEVRRVLRQSLDPTSEELPAAVLRYIRSHRLYAE